MLVNVSQNLLYIHNLVCAKSISAVLVLKICVLQTPLIVTLKATKWYEQPSESFILEQSYRVFIVLCLLWEYFKNKSLQNYPQDIYQLKANDT